MRLLTIIMLTGVFVQMNAAQADTRENNKHSTCPVGLVNGLTLDEEFGAGASEITRCLQKTKKVKVVYNVNQACVAGDCSRPYALNNIYNSINDYEITHGMKAGRHYVINAVVYAGGSDLMLKDNPFQDMVVDLMSRGVRFYLCQNTSRNKGIKIQDIIGGVRFVTSGVTALADFQQLGYAVVTPHQE